jgi:hypothetical protein
MSKKISFCTVVHNRLWQLERTLVENVKLLSDEVELCVLAFNDDTVKPFLETNYAKELEEGKIVLKVHDEADKSFEFAYCKDLAHRMGSGIVLMNLDADNYIGAAIQQMQLILDVPNIALQLYNHPKQTVNNTGVQGRIALRKEHYETVGGYVTGDRDEDPIGGQHENMMFKALQKIGVKVWNLPCVKRPLSNIPPPSK